jgi:predicted Zn-dependent protease
MTNVFSMQERIARDVASALQAPLGLRAESSLAARRSIDDGEDYLKYLRAAGLFHSRGLENIKESAQLLEELVERYPNDAASWAMLAQAYNFIPNFEPDWFSGDF